MARGHAPAVAQVQLCRRHRALSGPHRAEETGIVALSVAGAPVSLGRLSQPTSLFAVLGFAVMAWLMIKGARGAIVIGVLAITLLSFLFGITPMPRSWVGLPPSPGPLVLQLDIAGALSSLRSLTREYFSSLYVLARQCYI